MLVSAAIGWGLICSALAASDRDLIRQGYRWVTANGPYACRTVKEVKRISSHRDDASELKMVESLQAYYLVPGAIVQVVQQDPASGLSRVRMAGITTALWTYTRFLSKHRIADIYGVIETPENSGLNATASSQGPSDDDRLSSK